jgi:hypothetical protein
MVNENVGTDKNKSLLSSKDWYYSEIHRKLLEDFYIKNNMVLNQ